MRRKDREVTGITDILGIVDKAKILRLGLFDGVYPYIVPLHYGYELVDDRLVFFMHSAKEGHKLDLIRENPHVCIELECDIEPVSGGEIPCSYGAAFSSVIGRGEAEIVSDASEKLRGLNLLMENQTGRRFAMDSKMASGVEVIRVVVSACTAKARKKPQQHAS